MENLVERIFWTTDQIRLKCWQEDRLYHSNVLREFYSTMNYMFDNLIRAYMSSDKKIFISDSLFKLENDVDMNTVIFEIKEFLDELKTDKEGWGGAMQGMIDEILGVVEVFANTFNKK